MRKKVLLVVAHPDDEIIFFWWALQNPEWECSILCCSSDANNPKRQKWAHRKNGFISFCEHLSVKYRILDYNSNFNELDGRDSDGKLDGALMLCGNDIINSIKEFGIDIVCTHNEWGEYGKPDHRHLNYLVRSIEGLTVYTSDILIETGWHPLKPALYNPPILMQCQNDLEKYAKWKEFYTRIKCWTWNKEPVESCLVNQISM